MEKSVNVVAELKWLSLKWPSRPTSTFRSAMRAVRDMLSCHRREDLEHLTKQLNAEHGRQKAALREVAPFAVELDHELVVTPRRNAVCLNTWHEGGVASESDDHVRLEPALVGFLVNLHHLQKKRERERENACLFLGRAGLFPGTEHRSCGCPSAVSTRPRGYQPALFALGALLELRACAKLKKKQAPLVFGSSLVGVFFLIFITKIKKKWRNTAQCECRASVFVFETENEELYTKIRELINGYFVETKLYPLPGNDSRKWSLWNPIYQEVDPPDDVLKHLVKLCRDVNIQCSAIKYGEREGKLLYCKDEFRPRCLRACSKRTLRMDNWKAKPPKNPDKTSQASQIGLVSIEGKRKKLVYKTRQQDKKPGKYSHRTQVFAFDVLVSLRLSQIKWAHSEERYRYIVPRVRLYNASRERSVGGLVGRTDRKGYV